MDTPKLVTTILDTSTIIRGSPPVSCSAIPRAADDRPIYQREQSGHSARVPLQHGHARRIPPDAQRLVSGPAHQRSAVRGDGRETKGK